MAIHSHQRVIEFVERGCCCLRLRSCLRFVGQFGEHLRLVGAIAVVHAVVAGQVARGFAGGDDVVSGHAVLAVRQRDFFHCRAERLVDVERFADGGFDFAVEARAEMLADQAELQIRSSGLLTVCEYGGTGHIERGGIARVVAGDRFQQQRGIFGRAGRAGRSGRGCWRTRPGRSG